MTGTLTALAERGLVPDPLLRAGIRRLLRSRLAHEEAALGGRTPAERLADFASSLRDEPVAVETVRANEQHYEVPAALFELMLGPLLKYSCCHWPDGVASLADAEASMLRLTAERAGIEDGQTILDLGCGWGSLTIWLARHYPRCSILALSNSASQRAFIEARCRAEGLDRVRVVTANAASFDTDERFDRVVSVEMFEHLRNPAALLARIARWLTPGGRLFVHVFCHREHAYLFEDAPDSWMGTHFFTGGMMPAERLYREFRDDLVVEEQWRVGGLHYAKTLAAWRHRLDARRAEAARILADAPGGISAARQVGRWRLFLLGCEESFAWDGGEAWYVTHLRFAPR